MASQYFRLPMPTPASAPSPGPASTLAFVSASASASVTTVSAPASVATSPTRTRDGDTGIHDDDDMDDDMESVDDDEDDNNNIEKPIASTTTPAKPKMVSTGIQAGGVDQATQTDLPCLRCMHGPPQHHLPPGTIYHPQYYPNYYQQPSPYPIGSDPHPTQPWPQYPSYPQQPHPHPVAHPPYPLPLAQPPQQPRQPQQSQQPQQHSQHTPALTHGHSHNDWRQHQPPPSTQYHRQMPPGRPPTHPSATNISQGPAIQPRPTGHVQHTTAATVQPARHGRPPKAAESVPLEDVRPLSPLPGPPTWDKMVLRRTWDTLEDAENDIKNFAEFLGFALVRRRSGNRDPVTGKPTRIHFCCHLDAARKPLIDPADRKRKRESAASIIKRQEGCPWQICLKWNKRPGNQPHLYQKWHLMWTGGTENMRMREHNHEMDPDPANIPANRRRHMTQSIRDEVVALLDAGGMSSSGVCEIMQKRHPRINFNKSTIDNMRRAELSRRQEEGDNEATGSADHEGQGAESATPPGAQVAPAGGSRANSRKADTDDENEEHDIGEDDDDDNEADSQLQDEAAGIAART